MTDRKEFLKEVYYDTKNKCKSYHYGRLIRGVSTLYTSFNEFEIIPRFENTYIDVINEDVLTIVSNFRQNKTLVLNLASEICPGGGVAKGSMAQEEELFRRTNYFSCVNRLFYPIPKTSVIVTENVTVLKDNNYEDLTDIYRVSFIAACAIRKPELNKGRYNSQDYEIMCMTIENIFKTAYLLNYDTLILGALGCGAFRNPPRIVASIFKRMLEKYNKCFKNIVFAIMSNRDDNFYIFQEILLG